MNTSVKRRMCKKPRNLELATGGLCLNLPMEGRRNQKQKCVGASHSGRLIKEKIHLRMNELYMERPRELEFVTCGFRVAGASHGQAIECVGVELRIFQFLLLHAEKSRGSGVNRKPGGF